MLIICSRHLYKILISRHQLKKYNYIDNDYGLEVSMLGLTSEKKSTWKPP